MVLVYLNSVSQTTYLFFQARLSEGEKKSLDVFRPESVYTSRLDGMTQIVVDLLFGVL